MSHRPTIVVVDFGSQYSQLITRRLRELGAFSELITPAMSESLKDREDLAGIILSGGPSSVSEAEAPGSGGTLVGLGKPVLGICYGMQLMAKELGGRVERAKGREYGDARLEIAVQSRLFHSTPALQNVWMSHGDQVTRVPEGFKVTAQSEDGVIAAMADELRDFYALQFHPEVSHTQYGMHILENFVRTICKVEEGWDRGSFIEEEIASIRKQVGEDRVLCAVSGGVDSTVMAVLVDHAVGPQLTAVFVDNGLLRQGEAMRVTKRLGALLHHRLQVVDAREIFLSRLKGVTDPEEKRRVIGHTFIDVFEEAAKTHGPFKFLAQGTLYPDRIESLSVKGPSHVIKTHHNVGGLPERLGFQLIEPLAELFKDEVRAIGAQLNISSELLTRHPFPGPGLAVRCLGEVNEERLALLRQADAIFIEELRRSGLYDRIWQAGAVLLPLKSVGVMGDARSYESVVALRAVTSVDAMTADWARIPDEVLARVSSRIVREVSGVNRVVYDISSKPPSTIEWE
jgi:GMP synthase (glutamine-hydrolysing)